MSRITGRPTTGPINAWAGTSSSSNYTGTATPIIGTQAYSSIPDGQAQPTTGTGFYAPGFSTLCGQKFDTSDGRTLTLVQNGTVALVSGKVVATPAEVTAFEKLAMTVPAAYPATAGTTQILVTNGATVLKQNQFAQGYLVTASGTGLGQTFKIASHAPAAASATFVVTLEDAIITALDATTTVSLIANPYIGIIVKPASASGSPVGVAIYPIAASTAATYDGTSGLLTANGVAQYGLIQSKGPVGCLIDTTTNVGYPLGASASVAGALTVATLTTVPQIAISMQTQTDTQYGLAYLML